MTKQPAKKGDSLTKHFTADFINQLKRDNLPPEPLTVPVRDRYDTLLGQIDPANTSFVRINTFEAALVEEPFIPQNADTSKHLHTTGCKVHSITDWSKYRAWGIALEPINQFKAGRVLMNGIGWLDITSMSETTTEHTHIDIRDDKLILQNSGPCRIISFKKPHALVVMNNSPPGKIICYTTSTIAPATLAAGILTPIFATVKVYDWNSTGTTLNDTSKTISVCNMSLGTVATNVFIQAFFYGRHFVIDWEMCPA